ncbi:MAG: cytochrome c peroxidase [Vicinamibacterales bacterium]
MTLRTCVVTALSAGIVCASLVSVMAGPRQRWTAAQLEELRSLSLLALDPLPPDPTNRVADDPVAVSLGRRLFFDTRLSANGHVACGTCHQPERGFQDGRALAVGIGTTARRAMPLAGMARAPFLFWDGRKDSLWAQALGPLESEVEHGGTRVQYAQVIAAHYRREYEALFGALPDLTGVFASPEPEEAIAAWKTLHEALWDTVTGIFVNIGKAIAAYERSIGFGPSRFDAYVAAVISGATGEGLLTGEEVAGLRLFTGKAHCTQCHNGPLLTNNEFHNTGVPARPGAVVDQGRLDGAAAAARDEFNCRSRWSDARERCAELDFMLTGDHTQARAYKVPSLRNVADRPPYMHAGQFDTLAQVIDHYDRAPAAVLGRTELHPLRLAPVERRQLEAFLRTLSGPILSAGTEGVQVSR